MLNAWHGLLDMSKHDKAWHERDMADELAEYYEETHWFKRWSELSDVVYTCTRGRWTGHQIEFPFSRLQFAAGVVYMLPKYSGRWLFFRTAGKKAGAPAPLHEVRNPQKTHKLHHIANNHDIEPELFQQICEKQLKYWQLLP